MKCLGSRASILLHSMLTHVPQLQTRISGMARWQFYTRATSRSLCGDGPVGSLGQVQRYTRAQNSRESEWDLTKTGREPSLSPLAPPVAGGHNRKLSDWQGQKRKVPTSCTAWSKPWMKIPLGMHEIWMGAILFAVNQASALAMDWQVHAFGSFKVDPNMYQPQFFW